MQRHDKQVSQAATLLAARRWRSVDKHARVEHARGMAHVRWQQKVEADGATTPDIAATAAAAFMKGRK